MSERGSKTSTVPVVCANLEFFRPDPNDFLSRLVTKDETWLYHYDPETRNNQWSGGIAVHPAPPKNSECKNPLEKFSPRFFWDQDGILLIDYLPKGQTINAEYYSSLPMQLKDTLKEKRRGKVFKGVLFLHDNAPAHRAPETQTKLAYLGFQCLDHPPYSPDLASSDYHLFPGLKKTIERSPYFVRCGGHCCRGDQVGRTIF